MNQPPRHLGVREIYGNAVLNVEALEQLFNQSFPADRVPDYATANLAMGCPACQSVDRFIVVYFIAAQRLKLLCACGKGTVEFQIAHGAALETPPADSAPKGTE